MDRVDALSDPHRADDASVVGHGNGRVEQILAERVAVALALRAVAVQRRADLGPGRVGDGLRLRNGGVGEQPAGRQWADDDHARAELAARAADEPRELPAVTHAAGGPRRDDEGLRRGLVLHLGVDPPREVQRERDLERDEDQQQHVRERAEQLQAEAHSTSSAPEKRKPTPRTVCR